MDENKKPTSASGSTVATFPFWYLAKDIKGSTYHYSKGIVTLSKGLLEISDEASKAVIYKYPLTPDIKIKRLPGTSSAVITYLGGKETKTGTFTTPTQYQFFFTKPMLITLFVNTLLFGRSKAKAFVSACKQAAGAV